jgi:hypothetical protein
MNVKLLMIAFFAFVAATFCARLMGGAWFSTSDTDVMNSLTVFKDVEIFGTFSVPTINIDFLTTGLPKLVSWDYPFFGGQMEIFKYFLYCLSIGIVWTLVAMFSGVIYNFWARTA